MNPVQHAEKLYATVRRAIAENPIQGEVLRTTACAPYLKNQADQTFFYPEEQMTPQEYEAAFQLFSELLGVIASVSSPALLLRRTMFTGEKPISALTYLNTESLILVS